MSNYHKCPISIKYTYVLLPLQTRLYSNFKKNRRGRLPSHHFKLAQKNIRFIFKPNILMLCGVFILCIFLLVRWQSPPTALFKLKLLYFF